MLYMFPAVPPSIISSSKLYTQHRIFVELFLLLPGIVGELELTHDSNKSIKMSSFFLLLTAIVRWNSLTIVVRNRKSLTNTR